MKIKELNKWINNQKIKNKMSISKINIMDILNWKIDSKKIYNKNKSFFSIIPFKFTDSQKAVWFQPLIIQKEVGILGILKKRYRSLDYYLLQAKVEPGNINGIQLSPTVQATKSNYLRKHGGKKTNYLDFFIKKKNLNIVSNLKLSEQGSRYLDKSNKNILIDIKNTKIKKIQNFIWVTKKNLNYLLNKKNLLNMDTISVLSSSIKKNNIDNPINKNLIILNNLTKFKKRFTIKKKIISFGDLYNWKISKNKISDIKSKFFSIIFLKIKTNSREVSEWFQPIISDHYISFNGFLVRSINETMHYLLQYTLEPGFTFPKYTSTVSIKNYNSKNNNTKINFFNFFKKNNKIINFINSDEGGRFYKNETHNSICVLNPKENLSLKKNFIWASHNQVINLINKNLLSIEARNLFASFNIDKIK
tara:strand:- start:1662 stop:2918 length:1257 start_codon:yes stop_codon:yes gene_type:complete